MTVVENINEDIGVNYLLTNDNNGTDDFNYVVKLSF
jgi:hypothetical protein